MFYLIGKYILFIYKLISQRERFSRYFSLFIEECILIGIESITIVVIISVFIGAVTVLQTAYNLFNPFIPIYIISTILRDMTILELAPTFTAIIFSGKVGSRISSELGTMRITEQIDAIEVMGVNSASYLVLPKILASLFVYPLIVIIAGFCAIVGGYLMSVVFDIMSQEDFIYGLRIGFQQFSISFALIKSFVFAFLISSISSFKGYYTTGGAFEVGKVSTNAVTNSCIAVLFADFLLAKLLF